MSTPDHVTLPAGVARVDDWELDGDHAYYRFIVGATRTLSDHRIRVSVRRHSRRRQHPVGTGHRDP